MIELVVDDGKPRSVFLAVRCVSKPPARHSSSSNLSLLLPPSSPPPPQEPTEKKGEGPDFPPSRPALTAASMPPLPTCLHPSNHAVQQSSDATLTNTTAAEPSARRSLGSRSRRLAAAAAVRQPPRRYRQPPSDQQFVDCLLVVRCPNRLGARSVRQAFPDAWDLSSIPASVV